MQVIQKGILLLVGLCVVLGAAWYLISVFTKNTSIQSTQIGFPVLEDTIASASSVIPVSSGSSALMPSPTPTGIVLPAILPNERVARVPVLLYHYISENPTKDDTARNGLSTPPAIFKAQLETLKAAGFVTITFDELAAFFDGKTTLPSKPIILTFDDGYVDFYLNAYPILAGSGMKGVVFIPTGLIGGRAYMNWSQVEEIARSPLVTVAAHSIHHYALPKVAFDTMVNEIVESKKILEQHVGYPVNWMAYPYGSFDERVVAAVRKAGYIGAATTLPGVYQYKSRFFYVPRYRAGKRSGQSLLQLLE